MVKCAQFFRYFAYFKSELCMVGFTSRNSLSKECDNDSYMDTR